MQGVSTKAAAKISKILVLLTLIAFSCIPTAQTAVASGWVLGGQLYSNGGAIEVTILPFEAAYTNELYLYSPGPPRFIGTNRDVGKVVNLGAFPAGVELIFGIYVQDTGFKYQMGPGSRNPDGLAHAAVEYVDPSRSNVGFEDIFGGGDRDFDDANFKFSINNLPPTVDAGGPYYVPEGSSTALSATGSDPEGSPLTYAWDLDHNGSFETPGQSVSFSAAGISGPGPNRTVSVEVTDDGRLTATDDATVIITNVAPTVILHGDSSAHEGDVKQYTFSVTDPGPDSFTVKAGYPLCGSGASLVEHSLNLTSTGGSFECRFPDGPASPTIAMQVTDSDGADSTIASLLVAVHNVAPTLSNLHLSPASINENDSVTLSGSFTDPGTLDGHTVEINWGDGSTTTTLNLNAGVLSFPNVSHQYRDDNPTATPSDRYPIQVIVTDKDSGSDHSSTMATVDNVRPSITSLIGTNTGLSGSLAFVPTTFTTIFTDPGTQDTWTADFTYSDGAPLGEQQSPFVSGQRVSHQFATPGCNKTALVTVTDDDTGSDTATTTVQVGSASFMAPMTNQPVTDKLRNGQVLPVKVRITDCHGNPITNLTPAIRLAAGDQTTGTSDDTIVPIDVGSVSAADTSGLMRAVDGYYLYNMKVQIALNTDYTLMIYPYATSAADTDLSKGTLRHVIQATR